MPLGNTKRSLWRSGGVAEWRSGEIIVFPPRGSSVNALRRPGGIAHGQLGAPSSPEGYSNLIGRVKTNFWSVYFFRKRKLRHRMTLPCHSNGLAQILPSLCGPSPAFGGGLAASGNFGRRPDRPVLRRRIGSALAPLCVQGVRAMGGHDDRTYEESRAGTGACPYGGPATSAMMPQ